MSDELLQLALLALVLILMAYAWLVSPESPARHWLAVAWSSTWQTVRRARWLNRIRQGGPGAMPGFRFMISTPVSMQPPVSMAGESRSYPWRQAQVASAPRYGVASDHPPEGLAPILAELADMDWQATPDMYRFPLGWVTRDDGSMRLIQMTYTPGVVNSTHHVLLTGQSERSGKDTWVLGMLLTACQRAEPEDLQIGIIDGKGLDYAGFLGKAHAWFVVEHEGQIAAGMQVVADEMKARRKLLNEAKCRTWHEYRAQGYRLPVRLVYVSELTMLKFAVDRDKDLWDWLDAMLATARAFGIFFIIGTQTSANMPTFWRRQMGLFLAGVQVSKDDDRPNTNRQADEIRQLGAVPPSELPNKPGYFCVVFGREVLNIRTSYVPSDVIRQVLESLPDAPGWANPVETTDQSDNAPTAASEPLQQAERVQIALRLIRNGMSQSQAIEIVWNCVRGSSKTFQTANDTIKGILKATDDAI